LSGRLEIAASATYGASIGRLHQTIANPGGADLQRLHGYEESLKSSPAPKGSATVTPKTASRTSPPADADNFFAFKYRNQASTKLGKALTNHTSP
jgi:hypothetical protein